MRKYILWLGILTAPVLSRGQVYNALLIPDSLKKGAEAVVRLDEKILEIKSPGRAVEKEHHVYTILGEEGNRLSRYVTHYDKFTSISSATCILYDMMGKEIKRVKKKEMEDLSPGSEISLMTDERVKVADFYYKTYPYTVDFEEEDDIDGILYFNDWMPSRPGVSVQLSRYVIIAPKDYQVRYKEFNCHIPPVITESGDKKIYTWEMKNLPARHREKWAPEWSDLVPHVLFAPSDFEAQGYKGNMSNWENYGMFIYQLVKGRDVLPEDIRKKVHELTDPLKDERQKVYALYDFLQKNTHYISIQLGIGGWQPFDATYVATKRYGDCKALSNYMIALLKEAGITGKYVEIEAGDDPSPIPGDFAHLQGNHVISCVPMGKDTLWLECTSQTKSPGYMGTFTGDRQAVLIDEKGGHIVNTPSYTAADNLESRTIEASIDGEGNLDAQSNTLYRCVASERGHDLMNYYSAEEREKYLNELFNLPTYKVEKSNYEEIKGEKPVVKESLRMTSPNYASMSGKRMFILPNLFNKSGTRLSADSARKYDLVYTEAFRDIDSISIKVPDGYIPESVPAELKIDCKFGKYSSSVKVDGNRIVYYRMREQNRYRYPASDYAGLVKYYEQLYRADRARVVLVKKE